MKSNVVITEEIIKNLEKFVNADSLVLFDEFFAQDNDDIKRIKQIFKESGKINDIASDFYAPPLYIYRAELLSRINHFYLKKLFNIVPEDSILNSDGIIFENIEKEANSNEHNELLAFINLKEINNTWSYLKKVSIDLHTKTKIMLLSIEIRDFIGESINVKLFADEIIIDSHKMLFSRKKENIEYPQQEAESRLRAYAFSYCPSPILNPNSIAFEAFSAELQPYLNYTDKKNTKYHEIFEAFNAGNFNDVIAMYNEYVNLIKETKETIQKKEVKIRHLTHTKNFLVDTFYDIEKKLLSIKSLDIQIYNTQEMERISVSNIYHSKNIFIKFFQEKTGYTDRLNKTNLDMTGRVMSYANDSINDIYQNYKPLDDIQDECLNFIKKFQISLFRIPTNFKMTKNEFLNALNKLEQAYSLTASKTGIKREYLGNGTNIYFNPYIFYSGMYSLHENSISFNPISLNFQSINDIGSVILHEWIHHLDFTLSQKYSDIFDHHSSGSLFDCYSIRNTIKGVFFNDAYDTENKKNINSLLAHEYIITKILNSKGALKDKEENKRKFVIANLLQLNRDLMGDPSFQFTENEEKSIEHERLYNNSLFKLKDFKSIKEYSTKALAAATSLFYELLKNKEIYFPRIKHEECYHLKSAIKLLRFFLCENNGKEQMKYFNLFGENTYGDFFEKDIITERDLTSVYRNRGSGIVILAKIQDYIDNINIIEHYYKNTKKNTSNKNIKLYTKIYNKYNKLYFNKIAQQTYQFENGINYFQSPDEILARYFEDVFFPKESLKNTYNLKVFSLSPFFTNIRKGKEHLDLLIVSIFGEECLTQRNKPQNHPAIDFTIDKKIVDCQTYTINKDEILGISNNSIKDLYESMTPTKDLIAHAKETRLRIECEKSEKNLRNRVINFLKNKINNPLKEEINENKNTFVKIKRKQP